MSKRTPDSSILIKLYSLFLFIISLIGCSTNEDEIDPETEKFHSEVVVPLEKGYDLFAELTTTMDTLSALDSVLQNFKKNDEINWGIRGEQGLALEFKNGIQGAIFVNPMDLPDDDAQIPPDQITKNLTNHPINKQNITPTEKRAIFLNPSYWERQKYADAIINNYDENLSKAGFEQPVVFKNEEATLERFSSLDQYGIVHIYSHGMAWPSTDTISRILLLTGEEYTHEIYNKYRSDIENKNFTVTKVKDKTILLISPEFILNHNNFENSQSLIYGGFCFSGLGNWPELMTGPEGGAGYLGFDWSVYTNWNAFWNRNLISFLADSANGYKNSVTDWIDNEITKYYYSHKDDRNVNINFTGNPELALIKRETSELSYTKCILSCRIFGIFDRFSSVSGNDSSYTNEGNTHFFDDYVFNGSFSGNTFTAVYQEEFGTDRYDDSISVTLSDSHDEILDFYYQHRLYEANGNSRKDLTAESIPLIYKNEEFNIAEYGLDDSAVCTAITSISQSSLLDWEEADIYSTQDLVDFSCNEYSFLTLKFE